MSPHKMVQKKPLILFTGKADTTIKLFSSKAAPRQRPFSVCCMAYLGCPGLGGQIACPQTMGTTQVPRNPNPSAVSDSAPEDANAKDRLPNPVPPFRARPAVLVMAIPSS